MLAKVPTVEAKRRFRLWGRSDEEEPSVGSVIGAPFNVQHLTHVKPDSHSSTGELLQSYEDDWSSSTGGITCVLDVFCVHTYRPVFSQASFLFFLSFFKEEALLVSPYGLSRPRRARVKNVRRLLELDKIAFFSRAHCLKCSTIL